jgi:hypothetical protein
MTMRLLILAALMPVALFAAAPASPPADFFDTFNRLSVFVDSDEVGPLELAQASLLGARFFSVGAAGLPKAESWFASAPSRGRASIAGLFVAIHGRQEHLSAIQRELEANRTKRAWIYELVGTRENFHIAMENGENWKPLMRVLPSTEGCRALAMNCMKSRDPLVRRTGVYWGYWFASPAYWTAARDIAARDSDELARYMAGYLIRSEQSAAR